MVAPQIAVTIRFNKFAKIAAAMPKKVSRVVRKTGFDVLAHATPFVPVDTGALRNSGNVEVVTDTFVIVSWSAEYAIYQNFGTRFISGKFFANQGANLAKPDFIDAMKQLDLMV